MSSMGAALAALAAGSQVLVVDDEDRENEGDLVMAAECVDTDDVARFLEYTSGFLCVAIDEARAAELDLDLMVSANTESQETAFLVSVDYRYGTSTGISAADRAATIRALADPVVGPDDLARPGHVMPLRARPGGVRVRAGHTEAGVDLCRAAGLRGAALICEVVTPDRRGMMRRPGLEALAEEQGIPLVTIAELRTWLDEQDRVRRTGEADIPTERVTFRTIAYSSTSGPEHVAVVLGDVDRGEDVMVRVHSECLTGDLLGSLRCDCGSQLQVALHTIAEAGRGVLIYMRGHEGRGIGLGHKLRAYELQQDHGMDTVAANVALGLPVDDRDYGPAARILDDLGVASVRLMTNNPDKRRALLDGGITVSELVPLEARPTEHNIAYLTSKRDRMGHMLRLLA